MSITDHNQYVLPAFYVKLAEKTASVYQERGMPPRWASAKAILEVEKLANVNPGFIAKFQKLLRSGADDLANSIDKGTDGARVIRRPPTSVGEASAQTASQTIHPGYQAAEGAKLTFGEQMKLHGANLTNWASHNPGMATAGVAGGLVGGGAVTGAMLS